MSPPDRSVVAARGVLWPDAGLGQPEALYLHHRGGVAPGGGGLVFAVGAEALFDGWFNLFDLGLWNRLCAPAEVGLEIAGTGRFTLSLVALGPSGGRRILLEIGIAPAPGRPARLSAAEITAALATAGGDGPASRQTASLLVAPRLVAEGRVAGEPARLDGFAWIDARPARREVALALCITSFRRETALARSLERLAALPRRSSAGPIALLVADNGADAPGTAESLGAPRFPTALPFPALRLPNRNLGGSGGYARTIIEARARGASHCLLIDDDAACPPEAVLRAQALMARATDPASAVIGAMLDAAHPGKLWEMGATFRRTCRALHYRADLTDPAALVRIATETAGPPPGDLYGGWWFFGFPLAAMRHLPFPFFVRGDDVSFSLAQDFALLRPPGIGSVQGNFTDKESPLTWYLDLRSHIAHHLSLPRLGQPGLLTVAIAAQFLARTMLRLHYASAEAVLWALEDALEGPQGFAADPDLSRRRPMLATLAADETPPPGALAGTERPTQPLPLLPRLLAMLTLNGLAVPFFSRFGRHAVIAPDDRGRLRPAWGAARITVLTRDGRSYDLAHSKRRAFRLGLRFSTLALRFLARHRQLRRDWRAAYPEMTTDSWWRRELGMQDRVPEPLFAEAGSETGLSEPRVTDTRSPP